MAVLSHCAMASLRISAAHKQTRACLNAKCRAESASNAVFYSHRKLFVMILLLGWSCKHDTGSGAQFGLFWTFTFLSGTPALIIPCFTATKNRKWAHVWQPPLKLNHSFYSQNFKKWLNKQIIHSYMTSWLSLDSKYAIIPIEIVMFTNERSQVHFQVLVNSTSPLGTRKW